MAPNKVKLYRHCFLNYVFNRGWAQITGARPPERLNFARWWLIFLIHQYATASCQHSGASNLEEAPRFVEKSVVPCSRNMLFDGLLDCNLWISIRVTIPWLFWMGVKLGPSHWGRNTGWSCSRIGCWGKHLGLTGMRWQGNGEDCMVRSSVTCIPHQILFASANEKKLGGACGTWRGRQKCLQGFGMGTCYIQITLKILPWMEG